MIELDRQRAAGHEGASPLVADVFTSIARRMMGPPGAMFSPTTATLISGKHGCVLVDTLMAVEDVDTLADAIEQTGKALTKIVITHGHPDHYFGAGRLLNRFPSAQLSADSGVVEYIRKNRDAEFALFDQIMDFSLAKPTAIPEALASNVLDLEGQELRVINVGQGDIAPSTVIWVPSLGTVIAGDVAYNSMHLMLGLTGPEEWNSWIASINTIRALNPSMVITGHKKSSANNNAKAILDGTEAYIRDFSNVSRYASTSQKIVDEMSKRYPDYPNVSILHMSAEAAAKRNGR